MKMLLKRLLMSLPNLVGVVIVTFLLTRALPGDPAAYFAGAAATPEAVEQVREQLGLNRPLPEQFVSYVRDLATGNLGNSLATGQTVTSEIAGRLPASLELTLFALVIAVSIAIPLGVLAATRPNSFADHAVRMVTTMGVSLPTFFTGLLLIYVFYYKLGWAASPNGRLDAFLVSPPTVTGFYLIDSLIARDLTVFIASLKQLILPATRQNDACIHAGRAVIGLHSHRTRLGS
jgi:ABC-type dipeptide/oligopeptide/nickel transport system permease component